MNTFLRLEYNTLNHIILTVEIDSLVSAVIYYEDLNRKGDLHKDFSYLIPTFYNNDDTLDDERNLISIQIFPLYDKQRSFENKELIESLAEAFIEHRNSMNIKMNWIDDISLTNLYIEDTQRFIDKVKSYGENKTKTQNNFNHLHQ